MNIFKKLLCAMLMVVPFMALSSCGDSKKAAPSDLLKLTKTYTDQSNFIDDGIGKVTLAGTTDGDTASFNLNKKSANGENSVRIRFYSIDTPESTGSVEKWGKAASNFTSEKLKAATDLVLEATTTPASHDSYGQRYLGYIWYKTSDMSDFKMLNLEIVENGFSDSMSLTTDPYYNYFKDAQGYAKKNSLHIWSNDDDPLYNNNPIKTTLAEINADLASADPKFYNIEEEVGSKVRFEAYIISHTTSGSSSITNYYNVASRDENGVVSTMKLYGGYNSDTINNYLKEGYLYSFVGTIQKHQNNYQIAIGGTYVALQTGPNLTSRVAKDYYVTFNSNNTYYKESSLSSFRSSVTITAVSSTDTQLTITAKGYKSQNAFENGEVSTYTFIVPITSTTDLSKYTPGKTFTTVAYQKVVDSNNFEIASISDIVLK